MTRAVNAAARVGHHFGLRVDEPLLLQETNNVVVWLRPSPVVAKVGRWPHSEERLRREHAVAAALAREGGPVVPPIGTPAIDGQTGFVVTLWERVEHDTAHAPAPEELAASLRELHAALASYDGDTPSFRSAIALAREALHEVDTSVRTTLETAFEQLLPELDTHNHAEQHLHGEPHDSNLLRTAAGLRWIDLEGVCRGPLEWDLAFLPEEAAALFPESHADLLRLLRLLNSARVATWCWLRVDVGDTRWHAEHHLAVVRAALGAV